MTRKEEYQALVAIRDMIEADGDAAVVMELGAINDLIKNLLADPEKP